MFRDFTIFGLTILLVLGVVDSRGNEAPPVAEGIAFVTPVHNGSCIAVKVQVDSDQAVSGFKWFNGSDERSFSMAMVGSGAGEFPPPLADAVTLSSNLVGQRNAWSETGFSEPVASESGSLFLIMQYPDDYALPDSGLEMGVGYVTGVGPGSYYVASDGVSWIKVASRCQLLVEPVYCLRDSTTLTKNMKPEGETPAIPREFSVKSYPNPFNPVTTIEVGLPAATDCSIRIYDVRGCLVRDLYSGPREAGFVKFSWEGTDDLGQTVSSGLYFAVVRTPEKTLNRRLVLIK